MLGCLAVGAGGFIGAVARYLIGLIPLKMTSGFPVKTFLINIAGSFIIGLVVALALKDKDVSQNLVLFLKTGICGGFTTFSSFALETSDLMRSGSVGVAVLYAVLSMAAGIFAVIAAQMIIRGL